METVTKLTQPASSGLITVELTQDQVMHITAAIADGLVGSCNMPKLFLQDQWKLYEIFMDKLTGEQQSRIENARNAQEEES